MRRTIAFLDRAPARATPFCSSSRNKALLTLLWRTGQRIGDWNELHGCHGLLGLRLADVDERTATVLVRLKGARDEHRVGCP